MLYCDMVKMEKVGLKGENKMWFIFALLSAVFAALKQQYALAEQADQAAADDAGAF